MKRIEPPIPWRVLAIAAAMSIGLGLLWWFAVSSTPRAGQTAAAGDEEVASRPADSAGIPEEGSGEEADDGGAGEGEAGDDDAGIPQEPTEEPDDEGDGEDGGEATTSGGATDTAEVVEVESEQVSFSLFYVQPGTTRLGHVVRRLPAPASPAGQAHKAVRTLVEWQPMGMVSALPEETRIREVWISPGNVAYVDLGGEIRDALPGGSLAEIHAVYAVIDTLMSTFPEIRAVQILVHGQEVDTLNGHVDISRPRGRSEEW